MLRELVIDISDIGDQGVASLAEGLSRRGLPSLRQLYSIDTQIGPQGAASLASALTEWAVPSLWYLELSSNNHLGDAGLIALAPALRQLPQLQTLALLNNQITDQGLASLLAPPTAGVLMKLKTLDLDENQVTDEGCAALAAAIHSGALPMLKRLYTSDNPVGEEAGNIIHEEFVARQTYRARALSRARLSFLLAGTLALLRGRPGLTAVFAM